MPWIKIDDHFDEHPKHAAVGPLGWGVWLAGLAYCNRNLTDGFIPWSIAEGIGGNWRVRVPEDDEANNVVRTIVWTVGITSGVRGDDVSGEWVADRLVENGLWERVRGGYHVHDYESYQPSKAEVIEERKKWADKKRSTRESPKESPKESTPSPNRPVPVPVPNKSKAPPTPSRPQRSQSPSSEPRMTRQQVDSWSNFGKVWDPFKEAWLGRGLLYAPFGSPDDGDSSQRGLLFQVLDARPNDIVRWVREAPTPTSREIITYILGQWHEARAEAGVDEEAWEEEKAEERVAATSAMTRIGDYIKERATP